MGAPFRKIAFQRLLVPINFLSGSRIILFSFFAQLIILSNSFKEDINVLVKVYC